VDFLDQRVDPVNMVKRVVQIELQRRGEFQPEVPG